MFRFCKLWNELPIYHLIIFCLLENDLGDDYAYYYLLLTDDLHSIKHTVDGINSNINNVTWSKIFHFQEYHLSSIRFHRLCSRNLTISSRSNQKLIITFVESLSSNKLLISNKKIQINMEWSCSHLWSRQHEFKFIKRKKPANLSQTWWYFDEMVQHT